MSFISIFDWMLTNQNYNFGVNRLNYDISVNLFSAKIVTLFQYNEKH